MSGKLVDIPFVVLCRFVANSNCNPFCLRHTPLRATLPTRHDPRHASSPLKSRMAKQLTVTAGDAEDVALPLVTERVGGDLLAHLLLDEGEAAISAVALFAYVSCAACPPYPACLHACHLAHHRAVIGFTDFPPASKHNALPTLPIAAQPRSSSAPQPPRHNLHTPTPRPNDKVDTHALRSSSMSMSFCCPVAGLAMLNFIFCRCYMSVLTSLAFDSSDGRPGRQDSKGAEKGSHVQRWEERKEDKAELMGSLPGWEGGLSAAKLLLHRTKVAELGKGGGTAKTG